MTQHRPEDQLPVRWRSCGHLSEGTGRPAIIGVGTARCRISQHGARADPPSASVRVHPQIEARRDDDDGATTASTLKTRGLVKRGFH